MFLSLYSPMSLSTRQSRLDELFNDVFDEMLFGYPKSTDKLLQKDKSGKLFLEFNLPGLKKEDVKVELVDNVLHVKGERKTEYNNTLIDRKYSLPKTLDFDKTCCKMSEGVLKIEFEEKVEKKEKNRLIKIE
jgi:HSP20 family protein